MSTPPALLCVIWYSLPICYTCTYIRCNTLGYRGGTTVTVHGENLNSAAEPRVIVTTIMTYRNNDTVTRMYYSKV